MEQKVPFELNFGIDSNRMSGFEILSNFVEFYLQACFTREVALFTLKSGANKAAGFKTYYEIHQKILEDVKTIKEYRKVEQLKANNKTWSISKMFVLK